MISWRGRWIAGRSGRRLLGAGADVHARDVDGRSALSRAVENDDAAMADLLRRAGAFEPHAVEGWPSSIALLASLLRDCDMRMPVRAIITSSEVMSPGQQQLMRDVFGGPIVDHYGQTERAVGWLRPDWEIAPPGTGTGSGRGGESAGYDAEISRGRSLVAAHDDAADVRARRRREDPSGRRSLTGLEFRRRRSL